MNQWKETVRQAVIGTGRGGFTPPRTEGSLATLITASSHLPDEDRLLNTAAGLAQYWLLGSRPPLFSGDPQKPSASDDPPPDTAPLPSAGIADRLRGFIATQSHELTTELVGLLAAHGYQAPYDTLSQLLSLATSRPELREPLTRCMGQRGRWLAAQYDQWRDLATSHDTESLWQLGAANTRAALLHKIRGETPDDARELLQSTWASETAKDRLLFIKALAMGLDQNDQPFLLEGLNDRSLAVRAEATKLLVRLQPNEATETATAILIRHLGLKRSLRGKILQITFPESFDRSWERYGLREKKPAHLKMATPLWWLSQWLGLCSPTQLAATLEIDPTTLLKVTVKHDFRAELVQALRQGAMNGHDSAFMAQDLAGNRRDFANLCVAYADHFPPADMQTALLRHMETHNRRPFTRWKDLLAVARALGPLSEPVTEHLCRQVLPALAKSSAVDGYLAREIPRLGLWLCVACYQRCHPALEKAFEPGSREPMDRLLTLYRTRFSLHQEFTHE